MEWLVACLIPTAFFLFGLCIYNDGMEDKIDREVAEEHKRKS